MIGYSADETSRLRHLGNKKQSIMVTLGCKASDAIEICEKYNLLSPLYDLGIKRDGCFFCPNADKKTREFLYKERPDLVRIIYDWIERTEFQFTSLSNNWIEDYVKRMNGTNNKQIYIGKDN